jgi:hypothetical protein
MVIRLAVATTAGGSLAPEFWGSVLILWGLICFVAIMGPIPAMVRS